MTNQRTDISVDLKTLIVPVSVLLAGIMIAGAIFFGFRKDDQLSKGGGVTGDEQEEVLGDVVPTQSPVVPDQGAQAALSATTSIDDDAIMGDRNTAQVAIVEFSDYECPYCNRFRTDTLSQIKKELDPDSSLFEAVLYSDGTIEFEVKYYNGGCGFSEAIDHAYDIIRIKNETL